MSLRILTGDCREVLKGLPAESIHCVVTSPPYYGLRDYGTAQWEGGDAGCDHIHQQGGRNPETAGKQLTNVGTIQTQYASVCRKCGATRIDSQIGLEQSPKEYIATMVDVFREVKRVLRKDGTCWINIGDSYSGSGKGPTGHNGIGNQSKRQGFTGGLSDEEHDELLQEALDADMENMGRRKTGIVPQGLKPKDLIGIPWMLAFALRDDGWYLRSDIIWAKPNPMPESVSDRPTKAHEYVFLLTKSAKYFYDADAVREPHTAGNTQQQLTQPQDRGEARTFKFAVQERYLNPAGRNKRSVWEIATEAFPEAHFATYPCALVEPCIKAGCPPRVCAKCYNPVRGEPITESEAASPELRHMRGVLRGARPEVLQPTVLGASLPGFDQEAAPGMRVMPTATGQGSPQPVLLSEVLGSVENAERLRSSEVAGGSSSELEGWSNQAGRLRTDPSRAEVRTGTSASDGSSSRPEVEFQRVRASPECDQARQPVGESGISSQEPASRNGSVPALSGELRNSLSPCCGAEIRGGTVLDPFAGAGTTLLVADRLNRDGIGIELSPTYAEMMRKRLVGDMPMFAQVELL